MAASARRGPKPRPVATVTAGEPINHYAMDPIAGRFGPMLSSTRPQLVTLLRDALSDGAIRWGQTLDKLGEFLASQAHRSIRPPPHPAGKPLFIYVEGTTIVKVSADGPGTLVAIL